MRKIVGGKRYDTNTAAEIAEFEPFHDRGNFRWFKETLYRTGLGRWFLHGEGGPASAYREQIEQRSWTGGQDIIPQTEAEAFDWLCRIGKPALAERYFPDMVEEA